MLTEDAVLKIPLDLGIGWQFSRQIVNGNDGAASALMSTGGKLSLCCCSVIIGNYGLKLYHGRSKQSVCKILACRSR